MSTAVLSITLPTDPAPPSRAHDARGADDGFAAAMTPVLLYDGDCGFCAASVQFLLAHEPASRRATLRFAPLQGVFGTTVRAGAPWLAGVDSVVWYDPAQRGSDTTRVRSDATLAVLAHLGGIWRVLGALGHLVPRALRDAAYNAVAARRLTLAAPACLLPSADTRARFLA